MLFVVIIAVSAVIHVDESGIDAHYQREHGRALRGERVEDTKRGKRFKRTNVIAGLWGETHVAVQTYEHSTTSAFFEDWFEFELLSVIPQRALIIMDNASFHRKSKLHEIAARHGVFVLFLPTYSPDLNPIEHSWANFKAWLCDNLKRFFNIDWAARAYFSI
jgi:transposase